MAQPIGELLRAAGAVTQEQLDTALEQQRLSGGRLASLLLNLGAADERTLAAMLSRQQGVPFVVLSQSALPLALLQKIPLDDARRLLVLPVGEFAGSVVVALPDPLDAHRVDQARFITGGGVMEHGALMTPLTETIEKAHLLDELHTTPFIKGAHLDPQTSLGAVGHVEIVTGEEAPDASSLPEDQPEAFIAPDTDSKMRQLSERMRDAAPVILVVDDDETLRKMLIEFLSKSGYDAWEAADGRQAVEILQTTLPDAILLDAMLPGVHGFDICRRFKKAEATSHIPVIMISAVYKGGDYKDRVRLLFGANSYLEKPLKLKHLKEVLDSCLSTREKGPAYLELSERIQGLLRQADTAEHAGERQLAAHHLHETVKIAPFFPVIHYRLAYLYEQLGENYRAIAQLEQAAELEPSYPILFRLSKLYEKTGFFRKAHHLWGRCLRVCKNPRDAERIREHMQRLDGSTS